MQYVLAMDTDPKKFMDKVRQALGKGWKPQGGICIAFSKFGEMNFTQALIKEDK